MIGSTDSDVVYVLPDTSSIPEQVIKLNITLNITTGRREPFVAVSPTDPAGIVSLSRPIFSGDEKPYVYTQVRELSVLYVATGLK